MNKQELIERIEDFPCEASLVTEMIRINKNTLLGWVKELDLPQPIKLKDVIARIKIFDVGTQKVWLNEILYKLGSDYGLHKYYAGYKQGKFDGTMEREKVTVPQYVADWYEANKDDFEGSLFRCVYELFKKRNDNELTKFEEWIIDGETEPFLTLVNMHQFGYEVEQEKRYLVKMKDLESGFNFLNRHKRENYWVFSSNDESITYQVYHTRKELEDAGFGEVFNSSLFEVEEVEG